MSGAAPRPSLPMQDVPTPALNADQVAETLRLALSLANLYTMHAIHVTCDRTPMADGIWWDTRPMLSLHEHAEAARDLHDQLLSYALLSGLARRHEQLPHLVRLRGSEH